MSAVGEEENAAELQFGADFSSNTVQCLSNDELFAVLSRTQGSTEAFQETMSYLRKVATVPVAGENLYQMTGEILTQLQMLELELKVNRQRVNLHQFEIRSLANLVKSSGTIPDEALSWVPSLSRFDDEEIMKAINVVTAAKEKCIGDYST